MADQDIAESKPLDSGSARLIVVLGTAILVLVLAEWASSRLVGEPAAAEAPRVIQRPENVTILLKDPARLPPAKAGRSVWLLGNSHTYALPGMKQGDPLRTDEEGILLDELASRSAAGDPPAHADFYLLSYPNFLPFEMLTRVGHLLYHKHRPNVVFLGLTWRNIARDSQLRHEVYTAYRDQGFADAFAAILADPKIDAGDEIIEQVHNQQRRVARDQELERLRSDSDRLDEALTHWAEDHLTLMGKSAELRATIFRVLTDRVQRLWDDRTTVKYSYDLVEADYAFNVACLRTLVRLLRQNGATVICYYAPERSDLPPLMDPRRQEEFIATFNREAAELGITILDARGVVPNEFWGWVGDSPDRSHFTEPGHQRLAQFLLEQAACQAAWKELSEP
jgi:hypothetical protein